MVELVLVLVVGLVLLKLVLALARVCCLRVVGFVSETDTKYLGF